MQSAWHVECPPTGCALVGTLCAGLGSLTSPARGRARGLMHLSAMASPCTCGSVHVGMWRTRSLRTRSELLGVVEVYADVAIRVWHVSRGWGWCVVVGGGCCYPFGMCVDVCVCAPVLLLVADVAVWPLWVSGGGKWHVAWSVGTCGFVLLLPMLVCGCVGVIQGNWMPLKRFYNSADVAAIAITNFM